MRDAATLAGTLARFAVCERTDLVIHEARGRVADVATCTCAPCSAYAEAVQLGLVTPTPTRPRAPIGFVQS